MTTTIKETKTLKPTGVTIARNKGRFTVSWKIKDKNYGDGQTVQYRLKTGKSISNAKWQKWITVSGVGVKTTKKAISVKKASYFPTKQTVLTGIEFQIQGDRSTYSVTKNNTTTTYKPKPSDWSSDSFDILPPERPTVKVTVGTWPQCTFAWKTEDKDTTHRWFTQIEYQHILIKGANVKSGADLSEKKWKNATKGTSTSAENSITIPETSSQFEIGKSYTRFFRVRACGPGGSSDWAYGKHTYASSHQAVITDEIVTRNNEVSGYACQLFFNSPTDYEFPMNLVLTQYAFGVPDEGLEPPDSLSWSEEIESKPKNTKADKNSVIFMIDQLPALNQCLFVRINTIYDDRRTYGVPKLIDYGRLSSPSTLNVSQDETTGAITVTVDYDYPVPDSFVVVRCFTESNPDGEDIGIIPHGRSQAILMPPEEAITGTASYGVYAVVADKIYSTRPDLVLSTDTTVDETKSYYEYIVGVQDDSSAFCPITVYSAADNPAENHWYETVDLDTDQLAIVSLMESAVVRDGGAIPVAPQHVTAARAEIAGTIFVTWDWSWNEADSAEISWADHADAWESTDEPETYIVTKARPPRLNISGLETGITWYVRVRLIKGLEDNVTYGAYSTIYAVNLASAPSIPVVLLSREVIAENESVTASWGYTTTDGTGQLSATIAEAVEAEGGGFTYSVIDTVGSETSYTINASDHGWTAGETHRIAVSVKSESGQDSDSFSVPVSVMVAEPPTCEITDTSLVWQDIEVNPETYSGDVVEFETEFEQPVTRLKVNIEPVQDTSGGDPSPDHICPISGWDSVTAYISPTEDAEDATTYTSTLPQTTYGGTLDLVSGELVVDRAQIASYNGEALPSTWISARDVCATGTTPTIGAQVVYTLAEPLTYTLTPTEIETLIGSNNIWADAGEVTVRTAESVEEGYALKEMPLTVTVTGAGEGGTSTLIIERSGDYSIDRPDETDTDGFDGETIALISPPAGESEFEAGIDNLIGRLDDGAWYNLIATVRDSIGQSDDSEPIEFIVDWTHQASAPTATVEIDDEDMVAFLTPIAPAEAIETDVCDIYRLSVDKPQLIYEGAEFGTKYVDPFPTIGQFGGYLFVLRTANGDYITKDDEFAVFDTREVDVPALDVAYNIIEFGTGRVLLDKDINLSHTWTKNFQETQYLGGSIQGDWIPGTSRSGSVDGSTITVDDADTITALRRLAVWNGPCHVRTVDGSSYTADVQVSETYSAQTYSTFTLAVIRIDQQTQDGMTYTDWQKEE